MKTGLCTRKIALGFLLAGLEMTLLCGCGEQIAQQSAPGQEAVQAQQSAPGEEISQTESGGEAQQEESFCFTDDLGREILIKRPQRIAVLNASYGEIWALAGGIDTLVGASSNTWTDVDIPLGENVTDIGPAHEISLEKLLSCEPDLILASSDIGKDVGNLELYEQAGLTVAYFGVTDYQDYLRMLEICTELTGCKENYERYGSAMERQILEALAMAKGEAPKVLYVRATTGGVKVKNSSGTVLGTMLQDLGCVNIADEDESLLEDLSIEKIIEQDPDFIFAVYMGKNTEEIEKQMEQHLFSNGAWSTLSAVREGHYYLMESELYNLKPNSRWGEAYEKLAGILYGE